MSLREKVTEKLALRAEAAEDQLRVMETYAKNLERELELRQAFMQSKGFWHRYEAWRVTQDLGRGETS